MKIKLVILGALLALGLTACKNDPVADALFDVEIDDFDISRNTVSPGQRFFLEWDSSGTLNYDARFYVSNDRQVSNDDIEFIDEECGLSDEHCDPGNDNEFSCLYTADGELECESDDGDFLSLTDINAYLDALPKTGYIILEICEGSECDREAHAITFN